VDNLITQLRALARLEHDDHSIGTDAADLIQQLREELKDLRTPLPCGHPITAVHYGDEGTNHCRWCALEAEVEQLRAKIKSMKEH